jgi:hypothetical protein
MTIEVKVIRVPGLSQEVGLEDGATVADALAAANTSVEAGEKATLNGVDCQMTSVMSQGDRLIIVKGAKGNA